MVILNVDYGNLCMTCFNEVSQISTFTILYVKVVSYNDGQNYRIIYLQISYGFVVFI